VGSETIRGVEEVGIQRIGLPLQKQHQAGKRVKRSNEMNVLSLEEKKKKRANDSEDRKLKGNSRRRKEKKKKKSKEKTPIFPVLVAVVSVSIFKKTTQLQMDKDT
jgi:hypothetical protein